ncbi:MAG: YbaB/EbfC family nucleoid-associated protein [bacterium]
MSRIGMNDILKQLQKVQEEITQTQESLGKLRVEGTAGGGMVTAVANGKQEILAVKMEKAAVDPNDVELLEDLVIAAVNQALSRAREQANAQMNKAAGGMLGNLPGGLKIPGI